MESLPIERIEKRIYFIRGQKVMLDKDLAELYSVKTKRLNEQVNRNKERFPEDFMFQLTKEEMCNLRSQFATSSWGGERYLSKAFSENGVAMLSSILKSKSAIQVNIQIMRTFTRLRLLQESQKNILQQLNRHEIKLLRHDQKFTEVFQALDDMRQSPPAVKKRKIGFIPAG